MRELRALRERFSREPQNLDVAAMLAWSDFEQAYAEGEPRYIGYAQAALAPWWSLSEPPVRVLVLRATLRQYLHDFDGALADLKVALRRDPEYTQAWSISATIKIVQANYDAARRDCVQMTPLVSELAATACTAFIDGLTGRARAAHDALEAALARAREPSAELKLWVLTRLAEMAWRVGNEAQAEAHFKQALALGLTDAFLLAAYADFLLDRKRAAEVVALLKDKTRVDPLLLRLVLAEKQLNARQMREHQATLADRFAAARMRGDKTHEQEEARFELTVLGRADQALELAQSNWKAQREPRDARILLEAALAAKAPAAAQPVLEWLERNRTEDPVLQQLAAQLKGRS